MNEPFRDPELPIPARLADLLGRLTLEEKVGLLHQYQAPVERLGVGVFRTGTEALHGLAWLGPATVFPQAVGLASTWEPELVRRVGGATSDEVLAFHHKDPAGAGRNVWAPVVNPLRDPRWGRNEEGYSEDPWLTGVMATAYASGLRGSDPTVLKTAPTLKHFLGYNNETDRCVTSSNLPPRVLHEYELPAYRPALEQGAAVAVMPSYNLVNGRPAHLSPLINEVLRTWAPDDVLVVSDAYAPGNFTGLQAYYDDPAEAYAHAIRAGLDSFTQDDERTEATLGHIRDALERGLLTEADVDAAVRHALSIRFRLGEFDPATPYDDITEAVVNCPEHQELAREAARRSIVLLENDGILPLSGVGRVAVIGQLGDTLMEDWYSGTLPYAVTARAGIAERCETVFCEAVDRIALTIENGQANGQAGGYVVADPGGGPLGAGAEPGLFDLFDWGGGSYALRAAATGRYLSVGDDGVLVNDQPGPNGWEVRQTFRLEDRPRGTFALRHISTGRYVGLDGAAAGPGGGGAAEGPSEGAAGSAGDGPGGAVFRLVDDADAAAWLSMEVVVSGAETAAALAATADVAVVVVGDHPLVNGRETEDRHDLALPPAQEAVVTAVRAANPRTVMVISSGYPVTWSAGDLPAVLWSSHGGQEYGHALAEVLFGDADPEGRLTQTWYRSACELPDLLDYDIIAADATYQYYRGAPLYPFGHGLSYTTFDYSDLTVAVEGGPVEGGPGEGGTVTASATVTNTGSRPGTEVVQFYTHQRRSRVKQPLRRLRGFAKVRLAPGESRTVTWTLDARELAFWDVTRDRFVVEDAPHKAMVGRSARDIRLCAPFHVEGERIPPRDVLAGPVSAAGHDEYDAVTLVDASKPSGDAVRSDAEGAWILFREVDFGAGAAACAVEATSTEGGVLTLRLDDPLYGPAAATLPVPRAGRYDLDRVRAVLAEARGVHDLYLVFENAGITVSRLAFEPAGAAGAAEGA
ncbi:glycoside hydrolase family 3 protein [Planomonospora venezuelensis]|uniref:Exo-alpha-(1->6)-L-arabinopyranosidase n=1 Tax=Planomonospora venezuelensis TaxID=1999 RepID=A0A841D1L6_PLAVE|nr:glycoside hydrolase family 3 protein [Planomonospora venezuelensis]MBB5962217.1 beta-glucosidase [Planomonospora venezuelensis]GIN00983.1 sugar hydrolase [Planomonospora venezuelensis]